MPPLIRRLERLSGSETESSLYDLHLIRNGAPPRPWGVALLLSLGLTPLLIVGLTISLKSPFLLRRGSGTLGQAPQSISLLLHEPERPGVRASARNPHGPTVVGGRGRPEGTGALDPRLIAHTTILSKPSDAIDPGDLSTSPKAERVYLALNPALPLQTGGDGLATGTGRDLARGPGGLLSLGVHDFRVIFGRCEPAISWPWVRIAMQRNLCRSSNWATTEFPSGLVWFRARPSCTKKPSRHPCSGDLNPWLPTGSRRPYPRYPPLIPTS